MNITPPKLRALYGNRCRVHFESAANLHAKTPDPWSMQIPCRGQGVTIYPHGEGLLAIQCDHHRFLATKLVALGLQLQQDGDEEKTFVFPLEMFDQVAKIAKPLRRPTLTDKERANRATRMKARCANKIGPFGGESASERSRAAG